MSSTPSSERDSSRTLLIVLLVVGGVVLVLAVVAVIGAGVTLWLFKASPATAPAPVAAVSAPPKPAPMARREFFQLLMGKTPEEVKAVLGEPDSTQEDAHEKDWGYRSVTLDPDTGKPDHTAHAVFRGGKVVRVNYN
jgi:hypothetical protein